MTLTGDETVLRSVMAAAAALCISAPAGAVIVKEGLISGYMGIGLGLDQVPAGGLSRTATFEYFGDLSELQIQYRSDVRSFEYRWGTRYSYDVWGNAYFRLGTETVSVDTDFYSLKYEPGLIVFTYRRPPNDLSRCPPVPYVEFVECGRTYNNVGGALFAIPSGDPVPYRLTITDPEPYAVPEPATWAMMIGGLGMVGTGLRRRRQKQHAITLKQAR